MAPPRPKPPIVVALAIRPRPIAELPRNVLPVIVSTAPVALSMAPPAA